MSDPSDAPPPPAIAVAPARSPASRWWPWRWSRSTQVVVGAFGLFALVLAAWAWGEMRGSGLQARYFSRWANTLRYEVKPGPSPAMRYPETGPFDERLGYTRMPAFAQRLDKAGYAVTAQARQSGALANFMDRGFFPPFHEKTQAGLKVLDCRNDALFTSRVPQRVYPNFEAIPPLVAQSLAFIENRELLSVDRPRHNPAVEWARLGRAVLDQVQAMFDSDSSAAGGSTLATQIEKFRHSPEGRTTGASEKYRQMVSASVRAYLDGEETLVARQRILLDYLNSLPLGALRGYGDVNGVADGMTAWYNASFHNANDRLREPQSQHDGLAERGQAFREMLSLLIAQRRPSYYFGSGQRQLGAMTDSYLQLLAQEGILQPALRDAALKAGLPVQSRLREGAANGVESDERKATSLLRVQLSGLLEMGSLYDLDRLDLQAAGSIDGAAQGAISALLSDLRAPATAKAAGLLDKQLLQRGDPARLLYSFTLYESRGGLNHVRVQTDNLDQPFDINSGAKLELGSTAKLRTLVSYLDIIASLHQRFSPLDRQALAAFKPAKRDHLTRWALDHLMATKDRSLAAMLNAAMERRYSGNPGEAFFTGGGVHTFSNFKPEDNTKNATLYEALRDSNNLVFIRLMRDVVYHHMYRDPSSAASILEDPGHPDREGLLNRFADREGAQFMRGFYRKYRGMDADQIMDTLTNGIRPTPTRLAVIFRSMEPNASFEAFRDFALDELPPSKKPLEPVLRKVYDQHAPGKFSLNDRGYLAHIHPLELLVAAHLRQHPSATMAEVIDASGNQRREVYAWLFRAKAKGAQDRRIQSLLELDAFVEIHKGWQKVGYPFASLVPSYATAIGSSGDRPAALAELMGILVNNGQRLSTVYIDDLHFAQGTPYETRLRKQPVPPEQVLAPEVAAVAKKALALVVNEGTAKRMRGVLNGADGQPLPIGGKTGTGDNRLNTYGKRGAQTGSRVVSRTATFVFYVGDHHFGVLTAYVPGKEAAQYAFTSALPVQILKQMAPVLQPVVDEKAGDACMHAAPSALKLSREITAAALPAEDAKKTRAVPVALPARAAASGAGRSRKPASASAE